MWVPKTVLSWFHISKDTVDAMREELASLHTERDQLVTQLADAKANARWVMLQVNQLQLERQALLEKVYNVRVAAPQILEQPNTIPDFNHSLFEDLDELAAATKSVTSSLPPWGN